MTPTKPLKWAGSKRSISAELQALRQRLGVQHRLVEPFVGGAGSLFAFMPDRALLSDVNPFLINFYKHLQKGLVVQYTDYRNEETLYYANRDAYNQLILDPKTLDCSIASQKCAELLYFLSRAGFNGIYRISQNKGNFNIPWGGWDKKKKEPRTVNFQTDFRHYQEIFSRWQFQSGDFEDLTPQLIPTDFLYCDPPYWKGNSGKDSFTAYAKKPFDWQEQVRMAEWAAVHPGPVLLSNSVQPQILELYEGLGFSLEYVMAERRCAANGNRDKAKEVLALKNF